MRKFTLITSFLGLALSLSVSACTDDGGSEASTTNETGSGDGDPGDGDGDGDGDSGDGDGEAQCFPQPAECALFLQCLGALAPAQLPAVEPMFGEDGTCWCQGDAVANDCYATCITEVMKAVMNNPTESQCHESVCSLEELDATQPYGPIVNGSCSDYTTEQGTQAPQMPIMNPAGVVGSFCSPKCSGLANYCPESSQTSAQGTCYLTLGQDNYCVSRCYVDPTIVGGTQCQCGAKCMPQGAPDGEGNMRGLCLYP